MPLIVVSGPEKAGKSTLCDVLRKRHGAEVVHWGPVRSSWAFMNRLKDDAVKQHDLVVWDRSWVCEAIYAYHFRRAYSALKDDWWLAEWCYGRAVQAAGISVVLLGPDLQTLEAKRDSTDLPIDPAAERGLYRSYAEKFRIPWAENAHDPVFVDCLAGELVEKAADPGWQVFRSQMPPRYAGPRWPKVVFVGESRNALSTVPGAWLPFTTRTTSRYGRILGDLAFRCGWTNLDGPTTVVNAAELVVACGREAQKFARDCRAKEVLQVPHPSWLYRWGAGAPQVKEVEEKITTRVRAFFATSN